MNSQKQPYKAQLFSQRIKITALRYQTEISKRASCRDAPEIIYQHAIMENLSDIRDTLWYSCPKDDSLNRPHIPDIISRPLQNNNYNIQGINNDSCFCISRTGFPVFRNVG